MWCAVLSRLANRERPIAFALRKLNSSERNYSQTDKEDLAIHFMGFTELFLLFVWTKFTLVTDHQPLSTDFWFTQQIASVTSYCTCLLHFA